MPNTIKTSTVLWALTGLVAPFVVLGLLPMFGIWLALSVWHIWIISLPLCGYLAYRSYLDGNQSVAVTAHADAPQPVSRSGPNRVALAIVGAALGFGAGYLSRPTFLGEKVPLQLLFANAGPDFAGLKSQFVMHMAVATVIGLVALLVVASLVGAARK